jgi:hypothetical protein
LLSGVQRAFRLAEDISLSIVFFVLEFR